MKSLKETEAPENIEYIQLEWREREHESIEGHPERTEVECSRNVPVDFWSVGTKDQCEVTRDGGSGPREKNTITRNQFPQLRLPNWCMAGQNPAYGTPSCATVFSSNINLVLSQSGVDKLYHFSADQVFGQIDKQVVKILNGLNQFYIIDRI